MNSEQKFTFKEVTPNLVADLKADLTPMLIGQPGIGKSSVLKDLANKLHTKVFVLSVNQLGTKEDLTGARTIKDPKTNTYRQVFFPHADVQNAIDYAKAHPDENPILFLDEINRTSTDVTSAALALITERRLGTTKLPSNLRLVAAGNDKGNVISFDNASITRLSLYRVSPDMNTFLNAQSDLNPYIIAVLKQHPNFLVSAPIQSPDEDADSDSDDDDDASPMGDLNGMFDDNTFAQETVPRTITYTSKYLNALGFDKSHSANEHNVFNTYMDIVSDPNANPDTLAKGLAAHAGDTEFTNALYDYMKKNLMNAFQKQDDEAPITANPAPDLPKPSADLLKALNQINTVDEVDQVLKNLSVDEYQNLLIYIMTADGQKSLSASLIDALVNTMGQHLADYSHAIMAKAQTLSGNDKAAYEEAHTIYGFDKTHKQNFINLLTHDNWDVSNYTLSAINRLDNNDDNVAVIQNLISLLS